MHETPAEVEELQTLLDASYASAGPHLLSIHTPNWRVPATKLVELLTGMVVLNLATVNSRGEPIQGPVDGMFFRGRFWFGSSPDSLRAKHIKRRPDVSVAHVRCEELAVVAHGLARDVDKTSERALALRDYSIEIYGQETVDSFWFSDAPYWVLEARKMFALAPVT